MQQIIFDNFKNLFKFLTQSIYDSLMNLKMALKLPLYVKFTREKMSYTERKSLAIFQLFDAPGFLLRKFKMAEISNRAVFSINRQIFSV